MTGLGPKDALSAPPDDNKGRMAGMAFRLAHRIATNRSVAGVHFPIDSASGAIIGCGVGDALYRIATGAGNWPAEAKDVQFQKIPDSDPPFDLTLRWLKEQLPDDAVEDADAEADAEGNGETILGQLWNEAAAEWVESDL